MYKGLLYVLLLLLSGCATRPELTVSADLIQHQVTFKITPALPTRAEE